MQEFAAGKFHRDSPRAYLPSEMQKVRGELMTIYFSVTRPPEGTNRCL